MNAYAKWYSRVVWFGIAVNALFWIPALFAPSLINHLFNLDPAYYTVWLRNVGMLLILVGIFNALAAKDPARYPALSWGVVVARAIASLFFFEIWTINLWNSSDNPGVFGYLFLVDGMFALLKGILLRRALPESRGMQAAPTMAEAARAAE